MKKINFLIIVPTLNSYRLLPKLVNSLRIQTYKNWRVLFVDGNSNKENINYLIKTEREDSRFSWITQNKESLGIYSAMNQGLNYAKDNEWILFWGSDDWASSKHTFNRIVDLINNLGNKKPYLILGKTNYFDLINKRMGRKSIFSNKKDIFINSYQFRNLLFLGCSPPHQGTIFSPESINSCEIFNTKYKIAADLEYFVKISLKTNIYIYLFEESIANIGLGGFSSKSNFKRLKEVIKIYMKAFGFLSILSFFLRYLKRIFSVLSK